MRCTLRFLRKVLSLCLQRAGGHLLPENICLNLSNIYFSKETVDHLVAMVQDCVNTPRTEVFHDFLATGIRQRMSCSKFIPEDFHLSILCKSYLKRIYGKKPFR